MKCLHMDSINKSVYIIFRYTVKATSQICTKIDIFFVTM